MDTRIDDLLGVLSEPKRLRALQLMWDGDEHCVCELMDRLGATQSRMSRHMARLKAAGLVTDRRDAQWVRYRRSPDLPEAWTEIIDTILRALPPLSRAQPKKRAA
ncbi:ArsR family transcriptional regulator [Novosphingobium hassiacum]|uniref:ArsR family transcriptional regulator n=1 Tax=Novosphingobium hassiacum TaxID=173676 RepID=A0A7W5ZY27_9SPHN|nr:metalloregulator ArsR/SmtB family transcription factor [Novosphingobium hassiacum]MBB3862086.1 ArsR family transcriptional regulator [Novosphingobium hassiacum]